MTSLLPGLENRSTEDEVAKIKRKGQGERTCITPRYHRL